MSPAPPQPVARAQRSRTPEHLSPGYFALVMATGIVSIGADLRGWQTLSLGLLVVAAVAYAVLIVLTAWRLIRFRHAIIHDARDTRKAFLYFTFVAGTDVLAVGLAAHGQLGVAAMLLGVAGLAWLVLGYTIPWAAVLGRAERPVLAAANGTWFIWVVASQSVAVAAATLEPEYDDLRQALAIVAVFSWSVGIVLYLASGIFVSLRLMLYPLKPQELDPPYWVAMGAVAITIVAGARIVEMESAPMVDAVRGLVAGLAVLFWCFATWLIPVLFAVGFWRHVLHHVPFRYDPTWWSIVFPLGMYAAASIYLGRADDLPIVEWIGNAWIFVAIAAWLIAIVGMVSTWLGRSQSSEPTAVTDDSKVR